MAIPRTRLRVEDNGLGLLPASLEGVHVKVGAASAGQENVLYSFADPATVEDTLGSGPLARAVAFALSSPTQGVAPRPVYGMRIHASVAGAVGPVAPTRVGTSTGTVAAAGAPLDRYEVVVLITRTGTLGAAAFQLSLDGGDAYEAETAVPSGGTYVVPGTGLTLTFAAGAGPTFFEAGDLFRFTTKAPGWTLTDVADAAAAIRADSRAAEFVHLVGTVAPVLGTVTASGTAPPAVTVAGTPADHYQVELDIVAGGALATATFRYRLGPELAWSDTVATAASYVIPGTGLTLTFAAGTYNADNFYTFSTANAAGMAAVIAAAASHAATDEGRNRYLFWVVEAPDASATDLQAELADEADQVRVMVGAGYAEVVDAQTGEVTKHNAAWPAAARIASIPISTDPMAVALGPLPNVQTLYHDEFQTETLDALRLTTLRTWEGRNGAYLTLGRMFAGEESDFKYVMHRRVMDAACRIVYQTILDFQGAGFRIDAAGLIDEADAATADLELQGALEAGLSRHTSDAGANVLRDDDLLATETLRARVWIVPLGYPHQIEVVMAFRNPKLVRATGT